VAERKQIPTSTNYTVNLQTSVISIKTSYVGDEDPEILQGFIASNTGIRNGVHFKEGELVIDFKSSPKLIDAYINGSSELVLVGKNARKYSLDPNKELVYTF